MPLRYCLAPEASDPCFKVIDCWWETFDVVRFLQDHLTPAAFEQLLAARPVPKAAGLAGLAARLKPPRP